MTTSRSDFEVDEFGRVTYHLGDAKLSVEVEDGRLVIRSHQFHTLAVIPHVSNVIQVEPVNPRGLLV